jgi:hypothetical protein
MGPFTGKQRLYPVGLLERGISQRIFRFLEGKVASRLHTMTPKNQFREESEKWSEIRRWS